MQVRIKELEDQRSLMGGHIEVMTGKLRTYRDALIKKAEEDAIEAAERAREEKRLAEEAALLAKKRGHSPLKSTLKK